jgi:Rieske Fe-S protein
MPNRGIVDLTASHIHRRARFLVLGRRTLLKFLLSASGLAALLYFVTYGGRSSPNTTTINLETETATEMETTTERETTTETAAETTTEIKFERMRIANLSEIPPGSHMIFNWPPDPYSGTNILFRDKAGNLHAFDLTCTHQGCLTHYSPQDVLIVCPCHGSIFRPDTGEVVSGPAREPLLRIILEVDQAGDIYAVGYG